jgi:hypothetical protein
VSSEKPVTNHLGQKMAHKYCTSNLFSIYLLGKAISEVQVPVIHSAILNDKVTTSTKVDGVDMQLKVESKVSIGLISPRKKAYILTSSRDEILNPLVLKG